MPPFFPPWEGRGGGFLIFFQLIMKHLSFLFLLSTLPLSSFSNEKLPLDSTSIALDEVVVSANRWQQSQGQQPKSIAVITPRDIALHNPQTAADLLAISGKVFMQKSQLGGGSPMIRGFATNRLLYAIDGIRMNTAIFRSGNIQNVISLDPFALEGAEVVFGPGSVIYGSDAMGGVMSFRTKQAQLSTDGKTRVTGSAVARYSSANNERTAHFDVSVGGQKWAFLTSFSSFNFGDMRQGSHGPDEYLKPYLVQRQDGKDVVTNNPNPLLQSPSGYSQINLMQKIRFQPTENWDFQYAFHYSETSDYARYDRHTRIRKGLPQFGEWNYGPQIWMLNQLTATHHAHQGIYDRMALRAGVQRFEESRIDRRLNKPERNRTEEKVDAYSFNLDFTKALGQQLSLYYGLEYVNNRVRSTGTLTLIDKNTQEAAPSRYPQSRWESYAAYTQALYRLTHKLNIEAGARYNHYRLKADFTNHGITLGFDPHQTNAKGSFSGSLGLTYRPTSQWLLAASVSRGFRTPNVDDMGKLYDSVAEAVTVPNPALRPEYADNVEIGITRLFNKTLRIDLSAYYTHLDNALVRRDFKVNGQDSILYKGENHKVLAIQNAASAYIYGVQLGIKANLPLGFGLNAHANWQKGKEELDNGERSMLRHAAPFFGRAALSYSHDNLYMELYTEFQGRRLHKDMPEDEKSKTEMYALDADGKVWSPAWATLNLKAQYQAGKHVILHAGIENITDKRYRTYSSGISAAGRNVVVSATYKF